MNFTEELYYGNIHLSMQEHILTDTYKHATILDFTAFGF